MFLHSHCRGRQFADPPLPEQLGALYGSSLCYLPLASPGGKLPDLTALRNRQGWLMRGGDRLVNECSWMSGICSSFFHSTGKSETFSYRYPSSVFFANRFRSTACQKIQLPPGGSQELKNNQLYHSMGHCVASASGRQADPYNGCAAPLAHAVHRRMPLFPIHSYFLPTPTQVGAAGRVWEVPYRYKPRNVTLLYTKPRRGTSPTPGFHLNFI